MNNKTETAAFLHCIFIINDRIATKSIFRISKGRGGPKGGKYRPQIQSTETILQLLTI